MRELQKYLGDVKIWRRCKNMEEVPSKILHFQFLQLRQAVKLQVSFDSL